MQNRILIILALVHLFCSKHSVHFQDKYSIFTKLSFFFFNLFKIILQVYDNQNQNKKQYQETGHI